MADDWKDIFDRWASKSVSKTDKVKKAYVVTAEQKDVLHEAGIDPTDGPSARIITIGIIGSGGSKLEVSYYNSLRTGANRRPETRMGRDIADWLKVGDVVTIGRIGNQIFGAKSENTSDTDPTIEDIGRTLSRDLDSSKLMEKARRVSGRPKTRVRTSTDFVRNPYIVAAAILRSGDACEMPNCSSILFERDDSRPYLEVHHIIPLAENGDDTLENVAALCPACHRELHFGRFRLQKRKTLLQKIVSLQI